MDGGGHTNQDNAAPLQSNTPDLDNSEQVGSKLKQAARPSSEDISEGRTGPSL